MVICSRRQQPSYRYRRARVRSTAPRRSGTDGDRLADRMGRIHDLGDLRRVTLEGHRSCHAPRSVSTDRWASAMPGEVAAEVDRYPACLLGLGQQAGEPALEGRAPAGSSTCWWRPCGTWRRHRGSSGRVSRSMTRTSSKRSASTRAAHKPAIPAPFTTAREPSAALMGSRRRLRVGQPARGSHQATRGGTARHEGRGSSCPPGHAWHRRHHRPPRPPPWRFPG